MAVFAPIPSARAIVDKMLTLAQDALVSKLRVYCFGRLAEEDGGWHEHFALPILLEAMTLFG